MLESVLAQWLEAQPNTRHTNAEIEQLVLAKRRSRREWQLLRSPSAKQQLNEASRRLTKALRQEEDRSQERYIEHLSPSSLNFSLWKAHSTLSHPTVTVKPIRTPAGCWARSDKDRADTFAAHLKNVFQPNPATNVRNIRSQTEDDFPIAESIVFRPCEATMRCWYHMPDIQRDEKTGLLPKELEKNTRSPPHTDR